MIWILKAFGICDVAVRRCLCDSLTACESEVYAEVEELVMWGHKSEIFRKVLTHHH